ncbi:MAG: TVP38/TMEM64 family protein [Acidimicrobiia bacterium]
MDASPPAGRITGRPVPRWLLRAAVVLGVAGVVAAVVPSGVLDRFTDQDELRRTVEGAGAWGPLLFVGLMVLLVPLNVPGLLFVIPATTLFGTVPGVALSLIGGFLASAIGIVGARRLGRDALVRRLPPRLQRLEARLCERGFWAVVALRSVTFLLQPVDWLCGLTRMPMRTVLGATFVGLIPPTLVIALTGGGILDLVL